MVDGPPVAVADALASSSRAMLKPPNGLEAPPAAGSLSFIDGIVSRMRYSLGVWLQGVDLGQDGLPEQVQLVRDMDAIQRHDDVLDAHVGEVAELVDDLARGSRAGPAFARDPDVLQRGPLDLVGVTSH